MSPVATTGLQGRKFWSSTLYKIAYPVVHNFAKGTLNKNLPLEKDNEYYLKATEVTYLEAVERIFAGIAPCLSLPDDDSKEGMLLKELRTEALQGLAHAVDPNNPDYLNFRTGHQPMVDATFLAQAFLRGWRINILPPEVCIWPPLVSRLWVYLQIIVSGQMLRLIGLQ